MGILSNLNGITEPQIPASIARDAEVISAIASHTSAIDPHPIYLTQVQGDRLYRQSAIALADADIPAAIARDLEVTSAIANHVTAANPHPQYLIAKQKIITVTSANSQGTQASSAHGLDQATIIGFRAMMRIDSSTSAGAIPLILPGGLPGLAGYNYSARLTSSHCIVRLHPTDSNQIFSRVVTFIIDHI